MDDLVVFAVQLTRIDERHAVHLLSEYENE
jgi:hypothetical protein